MKEDILKISHLTLKVAGLLLLAIALVGSIKETGKGSDTFELSSFTFQSLVQKRGFFHGGFPRF